MKPTRDPRRFIPPLLAALLLGAVPVALNAASDDQPSDDGVTKNLHVQVATVFDQPIYLDSLTPHSSIVEGNRKRIGDEEKFQQWLEVQRSRVLRNLVFRMLSNAYMQENGITASEQEINDFIKQEQEAYDKVLTQYQLNLKNLQNEAERIHAQGKPIPPELQSQIKQAQQRIDNLEHKNVSNILVSKKQARLQEEIHRERVSSSIRAWKFNKLLHDEFGGKVIPADLTYEPYEAYAAWLQTQHDLGHFEITDKKLNARFWAYYNRQPKDAIEPFDGMWDHLRWVGSNMP